MKAFVTGGSGFIGTNLVADLLSDGVDVLNYDRSPPLDSAHRPYWLEGDILEPTSLANAVLAFGPTHLVHLAARVDINGRALADYQDNTEGTASVLKAIADAPTIARSVITSSQFVCQPGYYPRHDEDYSPHTIYGESKVVTEQLTRRCSLASEWTIVRPTTIWGPWLLRHRRQFFRVMKSGLYMHPGSLPVMRSWGYVGNVTYQIRKLLEAPADRVDRRTFYLGDPPRDLLDWVNGFSRRISGRDARIVPRRLVRGLGVVGDLAGRIGVPFPITTSRYTSMTQDYLTPMQPIVDVVGPSPYSLEDGIEATLTWLEGVELNGSPQRTESQPSAAGASRV
jgi:GlcNAc-P-P-Und epimerase